MSPSKHTTPWRFARWSREPLLQFLLIGAALFAAYRMLNPEAAARDTGDRIVLTQDDLRQMSVTWIAQGRPPPTAEQWASLIDTKVREEVLFREAVALGLDKDDTIVKRRMVQKMDFLAQDLSAAREPKPEEVRAWFDRNTSRFEAPPRVSFRHLYFSADRGSARAKDAAGKALQRLARASKDAPAAATLGDPFMFQDYYPERTPDQMAKQFGPAFARALFRLEPGAWQGPVESGYGWHVVFVESSQPARAATYEEVEAEVKADFLAEQSELAKRKAYETMRARYVVVVPDLSAPVAMKSP